MGIPEFFMLISDQEFVVWVFIGSFGKWWSTSIHNKEDN
jgi:hypothetical protein